MALQHDPLIGREIDGYLIEKMLGEGGMARVYQAQDVRLGRYVAVKVIQLQAQTDAEYTRRFEKEARAVAQLQHPNIVNIYRFGEVAGLYYMAMEYIEGVDLAWLLTDYAQSNELMQPDDVVRIISQVGSALDYAHAKGVIHRDIKPSNVMLDKTGRAILADFGLALVKVEGTRGEIFGTPHYIAPEQAINSAGAVPQSDQYSLGVILYQMLTGSLPYEGKSAMDIAMAHISDPLPSPLERNPDLHLACVRVLDTALQKEPTQRYSSCAALAADLERAMKQQGRAPSTVKHISLMRVSEQVEAYREAHPLPPLPAAVVKPQEVSTKPETPTPPPAKPASPAPATIRRPNSQRQTWTLVAAASAVVILLGLIAISFLLAARGRTTTAINPSETPSVTESTATQEDLNPTNTIAATVEIVSMAETVSTATATLPPATPTETPTSTPTPLPVILIVTATPQPALPTSTAMSYWDILILANGEDTLYVMNVSTSGLPPFPLTLLSLNGEERGGVSGDEWQVDTLNAGECVRFEKNGRADAPNITCTQVGNAIRVNGSERFWRDTQQSLLISFGGTWGTTCANSLVQTTGCPLQISLSVVND